MTFADQYADHAYADLIREAETQGIGIGTSQERERILNIISEESCDCSDDCDRIDMFFPHLRDRINNV